MLLFTCYIFLKSGPVTPRGQKPQHTFIKIFINEFLYLFIYLCHECARLVQLTVHGTDSAACLCFSFCFSTCFCLGFVLFPPLRLYCLITLMCTPVLCFMLISLVIYALLFFFLLAKSCQLHCAFLSNDSCL